MIEWIFVSVMCIGTSCDFMITNQPVTREKCISIKKEFMRLPFKPEVTLAAAQCMSFNTGERI
jgi:hypothetical protein